MSALGSDEELISSPRGWVPVAFIHPRYGRCSGIPWVTPDYLLCQALEGMPNQSMQPGLDDPLFENEIEPTGDDPLFEPHSREGSRSRSRSR